ncbi:MAG TPA: class A beta-lactamase [Chroococcales cyanobacterium]
MFSSVIIPPALADQFSSADIIEKCIASIAARPKVGRLGVSVINLDNGERHSLHGDQRFPLQSVFKAPLAAVVLMQVDAGKLTLEQKITIKPEDISVNYSPLADRYKGPVQQYPVSELIARAVQDSDNTAADVLMERIGGPAAVDKTLKEHGIAGMNINRYERQLQPMILGFPPFDPGPGHVIDRKKWHDDAQGAKGKDAKAAFFQHVNGDVRDSVTPDAMVEFLQKLYAGKLLSPSSTRYLIDVMVGTRTGADRLKAGLPPGSVLAHKTGTGPDFHGINGATNDVGIATLPSGEHFAIAAFLAGSALPEAERDGILRDVCQCVVDAPR